VERGVGSLVGCGFWLQSSPDYHLHHGQECGFWLQRVWVLTSRNVGFDCNLGPPWQRTNGLNHSHWIECLNVFIDSNIYLHAVWNLQLRKEGDLT